MDPVSTALEQRPATFQTTTWGNLAVLDSGTEEQKRSALQVLINRYWSPVYANLRARGCDTDSARDLTQAFFVEIVLGRRLFERAVEERGRFRTLILTALRRFEIDQHRRSSARGGLVTIPLESAQAEETWMSSHHANHSPDDLFDRRWALAVLQDALRRCEQHYLLGGRSAHWKLFEARVLHPAVMNTAPHPLAELRRQHGFPSEAAAAAAVQTVKRRLITLLHEVVAETVGSGTMIEAEVGDVLHLLGR